MQPSDQTSAQLSPVQHAALPSLVINPLFFSLSLCLSVSLSHSDRHIPQPQPTVCALVPLASCCGLVWEAGVVSLLRAGTTQPSLPVVSCWRAPYVPYPRLRLPNQTELTYPPDRGRPAWFSQHWPQLKATASGPGHRRELPQSHSCSVSPCLTV